MGFAIVEPVAPVAPPLAEVAGRPCRSPAYATERSATIREDVAVDSPLTSTALALLSLRVRVNTSFRLPMTTLERPEGEEVQAVIAAKRPRVPRLVRPALSGEPRTAASSTWPRPLKKKRSAFSATMAPSASDAYTIKRPAVPVGSTAALALDPLPPLWRANRNDQPKGLRPSPAGLLA